MRRRGSLCGAAILGWLLGGAGVAAGADGGAPAATVYATATVEERALDSATAAVTVLDRAAIESLGAATVADVLRFVPGLQVVGAGSRGSLSVVRIRGGDPNFTLVLVDGVPVNDGTYQQGGVFDFEGLPASAVERVEVVRGPFSSFYGSTGLAGVVQIFTRRGGAAGGEAAVLAGDAGHRGGEVALRGGRRDEGEYFLGLSYQREAERVAAESFAGLHLTGTGAWSLGGARLRLAGRAARWDADDYPEASGGPRFGSGELRRSEHEEASLGAELLCGLPDGGAERRHKLTAALYHHRLDRDSPAIAFLVPPSSEQTRFTRLRLGWTWTRPLGTGAQLSLGADAEREHGRNDSVLLLPPFLGGALAGDYDLERTTPGVFAELLASRGRWTVELGSRLDEPEDVAVQWSPRLGVSYHPGDGRWRFRATAGRAFKLPSFFALASPPALGGNPELQPEVTTGGDLGGVWRSADGGVEVGVDVFAHRYRDLVDFDFERFTHVNRARVTAEGVEGRLAWRPAREWRLVADVTWQQVVDAATGRPQRHQPRWAGGVRMDWRPRSHLALHLDARRHGEQRDEQIPVPQLTTVPGATVVGLGGSWTPRPPWRLELRVDNLLDADYQRLIGFPAPGRALRLRLRHSWGAGGEAASP